MALAASLGMEAGSERLWPASAAAIDDIVEHEQLVFAQYDHFTARVPCSEGLVHIGDAARSTSPQLGQGANMAMLDALALRLALDDGDCLSAQLRSYARMRYWRPRVPSGECDVHAVPSIRQSSIAAHSRLVRLTSLPPRSSASVPVQCGALSVSSSPLGQFL